MKIKALFICVGFLLSSIGYAEAISDDDSFTKEREPQYRYSDVLGGYEHALFEGVTSNNWIPFGPDNVFPGEDGAASIGWGITCTFAAPFQIVASPLLIKYKLEFNQKLNDTKAIAYGLNYKEVTLVNWIKESRTCKFKYNTYGEAALKESYFALCDKVKSGVCLDGDMHAFKRRFDAVISAIRDNESNAPLFGEQLVDALRR